MPHASVYTDLVDGYLELKRNFAVFKHLGWLAVVCQPASVRGFSLELRNSTRCKIEGSYLLPSVKFVHI